MDIRPIDGNALWETLNLGPERMDHFVALRHVRNGVESAPTLSLNTMRDAIYQDAVEHGLWEGVPNNEDGIPAIDVDIRFACAEKIGDEWSELDMACLKKEDFIEELADVIIMSMSVAGKLGIDIDAAIRRKMEINRGRPWKHEGEKK